MDIDGQSLVSAESSNQIWEVIRAGQFSALSESDDLYPYLPLLSRIALAHELRPQVSAVSLVPIGADVASLQDEGPFPGLVTKLQRYKEADKCRSYALLKWNVLLQPVKSQMLEVKRLIGSSSSESVADVGQMNVEQENLAQTLGHGLVTEYECSNDSRSVKLECLFRVSLISLVFDRRRMQILISELARLVREDITHKSPDLRSMLLSKEAIQEDLKLMLPFALYRSPLHSRDFTVLKHWVQMRTILRRGVSCESSAAGQRSFLYSTPLPCFTCTWLQVDDRLVLVKSVVSNCPSSVENIVSCLIDQISQGSSRFVPRNSQSKAQAPLSNKQDSLPDPDTQWCLFLSLAFCSRAISGGRESWST
eukprot:767259-Hanusia_phi.AAC.4